MEDKRISEKESLELIARMIQETQDNTARYAAYPLLIWGYTTVAISLVVWYFYLQTECGRSIFSGLLCLSLPDR